ncbi:MAG: hypothetical protein AAGF79_00490 [Pseudomonadota bacterium]
MKEPGLIDTGLTVGILQIGRAVWRNLIYCILVAGAAGAGVYYLLSDMPPIYKATTVMWFDERESKILASESAWSSLQENNRITYVNEVAPIVKAGESLKSLPVYKRVIDELHLENHPDALASTGALARRSAKDRIKAILLLSPYLPPALADRLNDVEDAEEPAMSDPGSTTPVDTGVPPEVLAQYAIVDPEVSMKLDLARALGGITVVNTNELTSMMSLQVTSPDPVYAAAIANAMTAAFSEEHNARVNAASVSVAEMLQSRALTLREKIQSEPLSPTSENVQLEQLERAADVELLRSLLDRLNEAQQLENVQASPIRTVAPATVPIEPESSGPMDLASAVFAVMLFFSIVYVIVRELMSNRIRYPSQLEELGIEVLAAAPKLPRGLRRKLNQGEHPEAMMRVRNGPHFVEAVRRLFSSTAPKEPGRSVAVMVTSGAAKEGGPLLARELARSAAENGFETVLVEADLRSEDGLPIQPPAVFEVSEGESGDGGRGADMATLLERVEVGPRHAYWRLPALRPHETWNEAFSAKGMSQLIANLRSRFDYVVVEVPPITLSADAELMSHLMDAAILMVVCDRSTHKRTKAAIDLIDRDNRIALGAFVDQCDRSFLKDLYGAGNLNYSKRRGPRPVSTETMPLTDAKPPSVQVVDLPDGSKLPLPEFRAHVR